jgi:hypothetical protein
MHDGARLRELPKALRSQAARHRPEEAIDLSMLVVQEQVR